jgi:hypothetical protein
MTINNPLGETIEIYTINADVVATLTKSGIIELPSGIYILATDKRSRKVVVK